jgi:tetratricopeptide (TPR) repeat protein
VLSILSINKEERLHETDDPSRHIGGVGPTDICNGLWLFWGSPRGSHDLCGWHNMECRHQSLRCNNQLNHCFKDYFMRLSLFAAALCLPAVSFAAGSDDSTPPTPTKTTTDCSDGQVWDAATESCVAPKDSRLDEDTLYQAVREFAYAGDYIGARGALAAMPDQNDDRVLTYMGFTARKVGNIDEAMMFYAKALAQNPDNLLARSYMGQGYVETGDIKLARAELTEIRTRGGRGSWPELSLRMAIEKGAGYAY